MRKEKKPKGQKKKRIKSAARIVFGMIAVVFCIGLTAAMMQFAAYPAGMEIWMREHKYLGKAVYVGMSFVQVVIALIPGEPVEIAGGYVFGALEGTVLYLIGASLGSVLVFIFVRKHGHRLVELFFSKEKIQSLRFLKHTKKRNAIFVFIFILPGTPKDLLCYFAGLTDIRWKWWLVICSLGRIPSLVSSAFGGAALENRDYMGATVVFVLTFLFSIAGLLIYRHICRKNEKDTKEYS